MEAASLTGGDGAAVCPRRIHSVWPGTMGNGAALSLVSQPAFGEQGSSLGCLEGAACREFVVLHTPALGRVPIMAGQGLDRTAQQGH